MEVDEGEHLVGLSQPGTEAGVGAGHLDGGWGVAGWSPEVVPSIKKGPDVHDLCFDGEAAVCMHGQHLGKIFGSLTKTSKVTSVQQPHLEIQLLEHALLDHHDKYVLLLHGQGLVSECIPLVEESYGLVGGGHKVEAGVDGVGRVWWTAIEGVATDTKVLSSITQQPAKWVP